MKTSHAYINEYSLLDEIYESVDVFNKNTTIAIYEYQKNIRNITMSCFFEGADAEEKTSKTEKSLLAKIGKYILDLVQKIANFIRETTNEFLIALKIVKTDQQVVSEMIAQHPELKTQVVKGLNSEWFTYRDIAKYEKDIVALTNMLEKNAIDHATAKEKLAKAAENFEKSAAPFVSGVITVGTLLKIIPGLINEYSHSMDSMKNINKALKSLGEKIPSMAADKAEAAKNIVSNAISMASAEVSKRKKGFFGVKNVFSHFGKSKK